MASATAAGSPGRGLTHSLPSPTCGAGATRLAFGSYAGSVTPVSGGDGAAGGGGAGAGAGAGGGGGGGGVGRRWRWFGMCRLDRWTLRTDLASARHVDDRITGWLRLHDDVRRLSPRRLPVHREDQYDGDHVNRRGDQPPSADR